MKRNFISWLLLLILVFVWGSSFIIMKKALVNFSSEEVACIRIASAFIILFPLIFYHFRKIPNEKWKYIAIAAFIGNLIPAFLFTTAQTRVNSSLTGILNSTTPLFTLMIGLSFFKLKTRWFNIIGVIIGLAGAAGLLLVSAEQKQDINLYGLLIILATFLYAININLIKSKLFDINPTTITVSMFTIIGPIALIYLYFFTDFQKSFPLSYPETISFTYAIILGIFGSALSTIFYNYLIKTSGVLFAASVTYLMPVVAVMWGIADGEIYKTVYTVFILLILSGVFLVNFNFQKGFVATSLKLKK